MREGVGNITSKISFDFPSRFIFTTYNHRVFVLCVFCGTGKQIRVISVFRVLKYLLFINSKVNHFLYSNNRWC